MNIPATLIRERILNRLKQNPLIMSKKGLLKAVGYSANTIATKKISNKLMNVLGELESEGIIILHRVDSELRIEMKQSEFALDDIVHKFLGDIGEIVKTRIRNEIEVNLRKRV